MQKTLLKKLQHSLLGVEHTRQRVESLYALGQLVNRDLEIAYSGLFIRSVTSLEVFIEELFLAVLTGRIHHSKYSVKRLFPKLRSFPASQIKLLLLGDRKYLNWLPYSRTEERANKFLAGSTPFAALTKSDKNSLKKMRYIRHALAHSSSYARDTFERVVVAEVPLPPRERTPVGYLRSSYRASPDVTRFEYHSSELLRIAALLAS